MMLPAARANSTHVMNVSVLGVGDAEEGVAPRHPGPLKPSTPDSAAPDSGILVSPTATPPLGRDLGYIPKHHTSSTVPGALMDPRCHSCNPHALFTASPQVHAAAHGSVAWTFRCARSPQSSELRLLPVFLLTLPLSAGVYMIELSPTKSQKAPRQWWCPPRCACPPCDRQATRLLLKSPFGLYGCKTGLHEGWQSCLTCG